MRLKPTPLKGKLYGYLGHFKKGRYLAQGHNDLPLPPDASLNLAQWENVANSGSAQNPASSAMNNLRAGSVIADLAKRFGAPKSGTADAAKTAYSTPVDD